MQGVFAPYNLGGQDLQTKMDKAIVEWNYDLMAKSISAAADLMLAKALSPG